VKPLPLLTPFVRCYTYREFNTYGCNVTKPKHAVHEIAMHFFFKGLPVKLTDPPTRVVCYHAFKSNSTFISSGFPPLDESQYISSAATNWATLALVNALPDKNQAKK
jgi:hypothetical protein